MNYKILFLILFIILGLIIYIYQSDNTDQINHIPSHVYSSEMKENEVTYVKPVSIATNSEQKIEKNGENINYLNENQEETKKMEDNEAEYDKHFAELENEMNSKIQ